jgi:uncharacterized protein (TIGR03435 family)
MGHCGESDYTESAAGATMLSAGAPLALREIMGPESALMKRLPVLTISLSVTFGMQLYANDRMQFDAASVKRNSECTYDRSISPASVSLKGLPLNFILAAAYKVGIDQISGPSWMDTECFDVFAKPPQGATNDQLPMMLQALLAERFKLVAHKGARPNTSYALVIDKNGPKFKEAPENSTFMGRNPRNAIAIGRRGGGALKGIMTMELLAKSLSSRGYGPVIDETGLKGEYEIQLSWVPDPAVEPRPPLSAAAEPGQQRENAASTPGADLFTALRETLGLRLEARKTQLEIIVIDHIERIPTEN